MLILLCCQILSQWKKRNEFYVHLLSLSNACLPTYASMDAYVFDVILKYFPVDKLTNEQKRKTIFEFCVLFFVLSPALKYTADETEDKAFNCNQIMHADHVCFMLRRLTITLHNYCFWFFCVCVRLPLLLCRRWPFQKVNKRTNECMNERKEERKNDNAKSSSVRSFI